MSDITVGQYLFLEEWAPLAEALSSAPSLKVEELEGSPQDVVTFLSGEKLVLLFVSLGSKDDLVALANLVKMSKKVLKDLPHKVIVVNFTGNKNVEKAIMKMGILDILEEGIKPRVLRFKIDFWVKSLAQTLKNKPLSEVKREVKTIEATQAEKRSDAPTWTSPLEEEADIWLVKNELEIKRILGRWLVKMMGPSPHVSSWAEVEGERGIWRFQVKESHKGILLLNEGNWFFRGDNKPEYNWKEHLWTMAGDRIELFFQKGKEVSPRFYIKDKALQIAKNSDFAKIKQQLIQETFNREHIFKKESDSPDEVQGIENSDHLKENLKGKSQTDNLGSGSLSGKTKTGADQFSDLSGKGSTDSLDYGAMRGKNKNYSHDSSPLEQKLESSDPSGPLKGKSEGESLSSLYKNETKKSSPLVEASNEEERKGFQESQKSPLHGKSETDHLASNYDGELKNKSDSTQAEDKRDREVYKDRNGPALSGKSSTDTEESFYSNQSKTSSGKHDKNQEGSSGKNLYNSDNLEQDGEDKAVEKYYKERNEATQYDAKDLSGKGGKTDEINGHLSSLNNSKKTKDSSSQNEIHHPSANLDNFFGEEEGKKDKKDSTYSSTNQVKKSNSSNIYPIRPRTEEEIDFANDEDEGPYVTGEASLSEISQTAKVYSFITQGSIKRLCDLDDYFDDMVMLRVSGGDFMELQPVQIDLSFHYLKEKTPLKVDGVIEGVDADENNYFYVTVRLKGSQVHQFDNFMMMFQKRQAHINQFIKRAKGL